MPGLFVVRYGEIGLKGRNRTSFEHRLARQIRQALRDVDGASVELARGRLFVKHEGAAPASLVGERIRRVFGVVDVHEAVTVAPDWDRIRAAAVQMAQQALQSSRPPATFKVEARRSDKRFPMNSMELNRSLGAAVLRSCPQLKVDVHRPDLLLRVEVRPEQVILFSNSLPGPGGLPVGSSGRGLLLLSGGIDSPVAGWMAMKRGLEIEALHFHTPPYTGPRALDKVRDLAVRLAESQSGRMQLHLCRLTEVQEAIRDSVPEAFGITVMRRVMMRIASRLAERRRVPALVTGENLGQVASQTLESLTCIGAAADRLVLRPLIGFDKSEIVARARKLETYEISIRPGEDCCTIFVPSHPVTRPKLERVEEIESSLPMSSWVEAGLEAISRESIHALAPAQ